MAAKRKSTAEAAAEYAAKDYFISQRTEQLTNAFNAGASWMYSNQWHDIYAENPTRNGEYLVLYLHDNGEIFKDESKRFIQKCAILNCRVDKDGICKWIVDEKSRIPCAITHWAYLPKLPPLEIRSEYTPTKDPGNLKWVIEDSDLKLSNDGLINLNDSLEAHFGYINSLLAKSGELTEDEYLTLDMYSGDNWQLEKYSILINDTGDVDRMWHLKILNWDEVKPVFNNGASATIRLHLLGSVKG